MQADGAAEADVAKLDVAGKTSTEERAAVWWPAANKHWHESAADKVRRAKHKCNVIVVDGNAKNRRSCCAAQEQHVIEDPGLGKSIRTACPCTPRLGSIFCTTHNDWAAALDKDTSAPVNILNHWRDEADAVLWLEIEQDGDSEWVEEDRLSRCGVGMPCPVWPGGLAHKYAEEKTQASRRCQVERVYQKGHGGYQADVVSVDARRAPGHIRTARGDGRSRCSSMRNP